jgi:hypothetical protein
MPPVAKVVAGLANYCSYSSATTKFLHCPSLFLGSRIVRLENQTPDDLCKTELAVRKLTTDEEASPWRVCTTVAPITIEKFG